MAEMLDNMATHSSNMAGLLTSLTQHFDLCVTAIRTTKGAAALARRKVAEVTQSQGVESVSISGVIAEQEHNEHSLEPQTDADRAEMLRVVITDAAEVDDVVQEIHDRLAATEEEHAALAAEVDITVRGHGCMLEAFGALGDIGDRLGDYVAAEDDFRSRWELEREAVFGRLREMKEMRNFYEGYAGAYDSLMLEYERRRTVDDKVRGIWRKAKENVDKLLEADRTAREAFKQDIGEFLPADLWAGMQGPVKRWEVVMARTEDEHGQE